MQLSNIPIYVDKWGDMYLFFKGGTFSVNGVGCMSDGYKHIKEVDGMTVVSQGMLFPGLKFKKNLGLKQSDKTLPNDYIEVAQEEFAKL